VGNTDIVGDLQRLIAFDLDGTLVDSRRDLADSANQLITELGGSPLSEEAIGRMVGEGAATLVRRAMAAAHVAGVRTDCADATPSNGALARFLEIYDTRLLRHTRVYDGMVDVVRYARTLGRVVVLTNKPRIPSRRILDGLNVGELFDVVVGGDGPMPRKPDPAALLDMMREAAATPATTLLIGDSAIDHETAARAGVRCCIVSFGFGYETFPRERLRGDEWIAGTADDLRTFLTRFAKETAPYFVRANGSSYEK
jgi:phosphoglycolate phosphatase